jgi:hypothetical protein
MSVACSVAEFIVPHWGDKVDSGIGFFDSYRPARLHRLSGRYDNLMPESTIFPTQGLGIRLQLATLFLFSKVQILKVLNNLLRARLSRRRVI